MAMIYCGLVGIFLIYHICQHVYSYSNNYKVRDAIKGRWVLIHEATTTLGKELSLIFAKDKFPLLIVGSDKAALKKLDSLLGNITTVHSKHYNPLIEDDLSWIKDYDIGAAFTKLSYCDINPTNSYEKDSSHIINRNINAPMSLIEELLHKMVLTKRGGYIAVISTTSSYGPRPNYAVYNATQNFMSSYCSSLYYEYKQFNIVTEYIEIDRIFSEESNSLFSDRFVVSPKSSAIKIYKMFGSFHYTFPHLLHLFKYSMLRLLPSFFIGEYRRWRHKNFSREISTYL